MEDFSPEERERIAAEVFRKRMAHGGFKPNGSTGPEKPPDKTPEQLADERFGNEVSLVGSWAKSAMAELMERATGVRKPLATPWDALNKSLGGGFWPGLHIFSGATGHGKSQLALQSMLSAAINGTDCLYVGLELDRKGILARLLSLLEYQTTGRSLYWSKIWRGELSPHDLQQLSDTYLEPLSELSIWVEFAPPHGWAPERLFTNVGAMRRRQTPEQQQKPIMAVLDFLQVVGNPETSEKRHTEIRERIGKASYGGRAVAREFEAVVLVLSSMSREGAKISKPHMIGDDLRVPTASYRPDDFAGLGKESGDIEYSADTVVAFTSGEGKGEVNLAIAKQRAGTTSWVPLEFDGVVFRDSRRVIADPEERAGAVEEPAKMGRPAATPEEKADVDADTADGILDYLDTLALETPSDHQDERPYASARDLISAVGGLSKTPFRKLLERMVQEGKLERKLDWRKPKQGQPVAGYRRSGPEVAS